MCFVYTWNLIFPDGSTLRDYRVHPCPAGTAHAPCDRHVQVAEPDQHMAVDRMAHPSASGNPGGTMYPYAYVEARPIAGASSPGTGAAANPVRLEWQFGCGRRSSSNSNNSSRSRSHRRDGSNSTAMYRVVNTASTTPVYISTSGGVAAGPSSPLRAQYTMEPHRSDHARPSEDRPQETWRQWTPTPIIIDVEPTARRVSPGPAVAARRSTSADQRPVPAGREHAHRRNESARSVPQAPPSPGPRVTPRRSTVSLDDERTQRLRDINAQIDDLLRQRAAARRMAGLDARLDHINARIEELRALRRPPPPPSMPMALSRSRTVEVHQRGETRVVPPPPRRRDEDRPDRPGGADHHHHHQPGESLDAQGRRLLRRDVDAGAREREREREQARQDARQQEARRIEDRPRQRRLTAPGEGARDHVTLSGLFRRPSVARRQRDRDRERAEDIVFDDAPRYREHRRRRERRDDGHASDSDGAGAGR